MLPRVRFKSHWSIRRQDLYGSTEASGKCSPRSALTWFQTVICPQCYQDTSDTALPTVCKSVAKLNSGSQARFLLLRPTCLSFGQRRRYGIQRNTDAAPDCTISPHASLMCFPVQWPAMPGRANLRFMQAPYGPIICATMQRKS